MDCGRDMVVEYSLRIFPDVCITLSEFAHVHSKEWLEAWLALIARYTAVLYSTFVSERTTSTAGFGACSLVVLGSIPSGKAR